MEDNRTPEQRDKDQASDLENAQALLEYAMASYARHVNNFDNLDSKASTFAGFIGIILALGAIEGRIIDLGRYGQLGSQDI